MIRIVRSAELSPDEIFVRGRANADVSDRVKEIIERVRREGDKALMDYAFSFHHAVLGSVTVSPEEISAARESVGDDFLEVIAEAAEHIREFHSKQLRTGFRIERENGVVIGQRVTPIKKVGVYIPGGAAPLSSTVLMDVIPAKIAGVPEIVMVSAPAADGSIDPHILAAAYEAGVDRIFKCGGAQAVAALAFGTESVPKVDKIVGPGSAYVAEAKRQVFGHTAIDMIAGPSEILAIADSSVRADLMAADMLSQAEHDADASAVLITDSEELALRVQAELEIQLRRLPREEIARASIENNGMIIVARDLDEAFGIADLIAPEHLELCLDEPFRYLDRVKHAGSVFLGKFTPEAVGDYFAGPNHTLPTGGTARFSSPLSVDDFVKKSQFIYYTKEAIREDAEKIALFARSEGLEAHALSVLSRLREH